jgi:nitroreductase
MIPEKFSRENMMGIEPEVLRAIIRERTHHTVEGIVYLALEDRIDVHPDHGGLLHHLLSVWKERGFSMDHPDLQWTVKLLGILEKSREDEKSETVLESPRRLTDEELKTVDEVIFKRRSIRTFTRDNVPFWMIEKTVEAGLWAPSSCNLQTIRVLIVDDEEGLTIFRKGEVGGAPIYFVICQDYRPYEFFGTQIPNYNRNYDAGAAVQNMLLMAHSLGLGAVWLTFGRDQKEKVREHYKLPDHMHISTYIGLGFPSQGVIAPARILVKEGII